MAQLDPFDTYPPKLQLKISSIDIFLGSEDWN